VKVSKCLAANHGATVCVVDAETPKGNGICFVDPENKKVEEKDTKSHRGVLMVRGSWDAKGNWKDDPTRLTLSCDASAESTRRYRRTVLSRPASATTATTRKSIPSSSCRAYAPCAATFAATGRRIQTPARTSPCSTAR
jgi:hypothetical protein